MGRNPEPRPPKPGVAGSSLLPLLPIKSITSGQASGGGSENLKLLADMPLSSAQLFKDGEIVRDHPFGRKLRNALTRLVR